jgi:hypothetical protein
LALALLGLEKAFDALFDKLIALSAGQYFLLVDSW